MISPITAHNTSLFMLAHLVISSPVAAVLLLMLVLLVTFGLQILNLQQICHYQNVLFCQQKDNSKLLKRTYTCQIYDLMMKS